MKSDLRLRVRSNVFLAAVIDASDQRFPVRIRNISVKGALLEAPELPLEGSSVELRRGDLVAKGAVAWSNEDQCGVHFEHDINVAAWVARVGHRGQEQVDRAFASLRLSDSPPGHVGDAQRNLELRAISIELDAICERLASSLQLSVELAEEVLRLEAIARSLRRFAG